MDDKLKGKLNELYDIHCMMLTERGIVEPMYFVVKDTMFTPILIGEGDEMSFANYTVESLKIAYNSEADGMILVSEQDVVVGKPGDKDIQALLDGKIRPSDHPSKKPYLILTYINTEGKRSALYGKIEYDIKGTKFIRTQKWSEEAVSKEAPWK